MLIINNVLWFLTVPEKHRRYIPQINHISMKMPSFPILSQPHDIGPDTFCNENKLQNCSNTFCFCTYEIDLPLNATVEIILVDEGKPTSFYVYRT